MQAWHADLIPLAAYISKNGRTSLQQAEITDSPPPQIWPAHYASHLKVPHAAFEFPEIYIGIVSHARVTGWTNLVAVEEGVICHDLYDPECDYTAEELHGRTYVRSKKRRIAWLMDTGLQGKLEQAAVFTDACATNYAHWLTEILPRIHLFCQHPEFSDIPLVVNDNLHPNLLESLKLVAGEARKISALPATQHLLVDRLYVTSAAGYVPFERRRNKLRKYSHGQFSPHGLQSLRCCMQQRLRHAAGAVEKKLWIRRNSNIRNVTNAEEIEALLLERGFTVVDPERLSFLEQVRLFSQAEVIVGATGAAFGNLMFAPPRAKIVILISDHPGLAYWYWQNIACATNNQVTYVIGGCADARPHAHSSYRINPSDVLDALSRN